MYRVAFDYILGVRPTYSGLMVNPSVPSNWKSFKVSRIFRGTEYIIEFQNNEGVEHGVSRICVDGKEIDGNILPITNNKVCRVSVKMGKAV